MREASLTSKLANARDELFDIDKSIATGMMGGPEYVIYEMVEEIKRLRRFKEYFDELYGIGLEVANWHANGELLPLDNFIDSAIEDMDGDSIENQ